MVTGEESYVFLPGHALISTRGDTQGDVLVDLMIGEQGLSDAALLFEEVMRFSSGVVSVSDVVDPDEETLELPRPGDWRVKVYVKGRPWPDRVFVVFDERQWEDAKLK
ncbi:hypothetical protein SAMN02745830_01374 [Streptomyces sp. Amel2xC10]|nr:hypothetical protein SAMN02745830_01374 [Streptomyces sp. Amel2xC10]